MNELTPYLRLQLEHYKTISQKLEERSEKLIENAAFLERKISRRLKANHRRRRSSLSEIVLQEASPGNSCGG